MLLSRNLSEGHLLSATGERDAGVRAAGHGRGQAQPTAAGAPQGVRRRRRRPRLQGTRRRPLSRSQRVKVPCCSSLASGDRVMLYLQRWTVTALGLHAPPVP